MRTAIARLIDIEVPRFIGFRFCNVEAADFFEIDASHLYSTLDKVPYLSAIISEQDFAFSRSSLDI